MSSNNSSDRPARTEPVRRMSSDQEDGDRRRRRRRMKRAAPERMSKIMKKLFFTEVIAPQVVEESDEDDYEYYTDDLDDPDDGACVFRDKTHRAIWRFAGWYQARGGYLPCRRTLHWLRLPFFDLNASMAMLSDVPDDNILRNRSYPLLQVLKILIMKYKTECLTITSCHKFAPNLIHQKIGRLWLMLRSDLFYRQLLPTILSVPHATDCYGYGGDLPPWQVRTNSTHMMLLILLARISNDMLKENFIQLEQTERFMLRSFHSAMDKKYVHLATIFSLFVDKRVVDEAWHSVPHEHDQAMCYMLMIRGTPCRDGLHPSTEERNIFQQSLATRALESLIYQHGLSFTLQWLHRFNMPPYMKVMVHRYFYSTMWEFASLFELQSRERMNAYLLRRCEV